ncbi:DUF1513 domain-containing protein [Marinibactrum halimedae]|uniref:DUF1513 domain-containing protein n=1 Tax=Marinibactrum halimedae TaxID=1444977 RepID=A0AA37TA88_9GAMM|nr:DUF1513 domain-containing protein [Marinibactrum halimedae]MCD9457900.1 DUF1513 domain-containing protein [Marinibactrum halimedae]GLS26275.1 hypothetical protein GCM10007877_19900 [Marinibactrum halimedae]
MKHLNHRLSRKQLLRLMLGGGATALTISTGFAIKHHQLLHSKSTIQNANASEIKETLRVENTERSTEASILFSAFDYKNTHHVGAISNNGKLLFALPVPYRAHDSLFIPEINKALFFARRPGTQSYVVDVSTGRLEQIITSAPHRHFYGHGVVHNGLLFCTENNFKEQTGCLGVYDIHDHFKRVGELNTHGIGPHQLKHLVNTHTLVIANGGILTHPEKGRKKLNLATMAPNLSYLDVRSGELLDQVIPPHHQLSLRHLDVTSNHKVVVGAQFEGGTNDPMPLVFSHEMGCPLHAMEADDIEWMRFKQYIASVAVSQDGKSAAVSSPKGNIISAWDIHHRTLIDSIPMRDTAGLVYSDENKTFIASNGFGKLQKLSFQPHQDQPQKINKRTLKKEREKSTFSFSTVTWDNVTWDNVGWDNIAWDNHLSLFRG